MARESKPFRDRNPVTIGAVSLGVIALLAVASERPASVPVFSSPSDADNGTT